MDLLYDSLVVDERGFVVSQESGLPPHLRVLADVRDADVHGDVVVSSSSRSRNASQDGIRGRRWSLDQSVDSFCRHLHDRETRETKENHILDPRTIAAVAPDASGE